MKAEKILKKVKKDYTTIATSFDSTRKDAWEEFDMLKAELEKFDGEKKSSLLDAGCGNGRLALFLPLEKISYTGTDNNKALLELAKKNTDHLRPRPFFTCAEAQKLPFKKAQFDVITSFAVIHHLPTETLQLKALKELRRILKPGGALFITSWNLWQPKYKKYIDTKTHHSFIPWGTPVTVERFYYAFKVNELRSLLKKAGFTRIKRLNSNHNFFFHCS